MKRSKHNLSHYRLLTCDMGELVPVGLVEVLPGDSFQHAVSMLVRASPLVTPPMHPVNVRVHHWFVPHRLIWEDWEKFITGGPDGLDASVLPYRALPNPTTVNEGTLFDYLGVPPATYTSGLTVSALPFRAYDLIYNEWYRDQDLVSPLVISKASGADATSNTLLQKVAWEKDYFTTSRPWEQKGADVTLPLGSSAPLTWIDALGVVGGTSGVGPGKVRNSSDASLSAATGLSSSGSGIFEADAGTDKFYDPTGHLVADLSGATAVSINLVREAFALQRFAEARARYGSRYTEYLRYLGVRSSDARLQRPEYLGGGKQSLQFSEVLQTASTTADVNGVGQLYGHGIGALRSNRYRRFFEEHGYVMSLAYVLPRTMYPQGLARTWNRLTREDFYQKELEHIGQQAVLKKEVFATGANPNATFGFQDRYDEYRRMESSVHGEFRSTLNDWHFARILAAEPTLNSSFVTADPAKRPFQSQSTDVLFILAHHQLVARRLLAQRGSSFIF